MMCKFILLLFWVVWISSIDSSGKFIQRSTALKTDKYLNHFVVCDDFKVVSSHGRSADSPEQIDKVIHFYHLRLFLRGLYLVLLFLPILSTGIFALISKYFREGVWFRLISFSLANGGAAFIKWAQWSSTRPDMFPEEFCNLLAHLQTQAPRHSWSFTKWQIEHELGRPVHEFFDYFNESPLASGSIAQVHEAWLNGERVAVKVRHPNVETQIKMDFTLMKKFAELLEMVPGLQWLNLCESLNQFSDTLAAQTQLNVEGKHLNIFNKNFCKWKDVFFPRAIIMTESVLVESFEFGEAASAFNANVAKMQRPRPHPGGNPKVDAQTSHSPPPHAGTSASRAMEEQKRVLRSAHMIVCRGEDSYLKMLLQDNLMHADLHPGNILFQPCGSVLMTENPHPQTNSGADTGDAANGRGRQRSSPMVVRSTMDKIVMVDAGMVAELDGSEQRHFIGLLSAMGEGDGAEAADCVMGFSTAGAAAYPPEQARAFRTDMKLLFARICRGYQYNVNMGEVLRGILNLVRVHRITIEANYATLVMNALCLDSLAGELLPEYNVLAGAKPLLRLSRVSRKLTGGSSALLKYFYPLASWLKGRYDKKILKKIEQNLQSPRFF